MPETITPHGFTNLGGQNKPVDTRDIKLGAGAAPVYTFPPTLHDIHLWSSPVEYQKQTPSCGAHSGSSLRAGIDSILWSAATPRWHYTPRFTWADIKSFDGMPIDWGTDIRSIFKSLTKTGALEFGLLGNNTSLSNQDYTEPTITMAMKSNAASHSGMGYGFITDLTFNGIKQFLHDHGPAIMLMRVGDEMWTAPNGQASWQEADILPMRPPKQIVSGHFVVIHSYDENYIYFLNSWSDQWGLKGHGYFGADYVPFINDVGTLFPLFFPKDLQLGMTDPDVKRLQVILNKNPKTAVAIVGPGSPGNETTYFGSLTKGAVMKFQTLYSISPVSGYVGPLTRAVLNGFV